jgi:hypothetical protein
VKSADPQILFYLSFNLEQGEAHFFCTGRREDGRDEVIVRQEGCMQGSCCEGLKVI